MLAVWIAGVPGGRAAAQASWRVLGVGAADPPTFRKPIALALDGTGSVYVADEGYGFVIRATSGGEFDGAWGRELNVQEIAKPTAVAVGPDGNVFVADRETKAVHQLSPDGTLLTSWEVGAATSLAIDREGNLLVGYGGTEGRTAFLNGQFHLQRLSPGGEQLGRWILGASGSGSSPSRGTASGQAYLGVTAEAVQPGGRIVILNHRSTFYRAGGTEETHVFAELKGLEASAPVWSSTSSSTKDLAGGEAGDAPGKFNAPLGVAVDAAGFIYVADTGNHRIQKLTADGAFVAQWGGMGSEPGQFNAPSGIAVDGQGRVYVTDTGNGRVQVLDTAP
jgi:DNA-binding beta-propeller fold protein YncE